MIPTSYETTTIAEATDSEDFVESYAIFYFAKISFKILSKVANKIIITIDAKEVNHDTDYSYLTEFPVPF